MGRNAYLGAAILTEVVATLSLEPAFTQPLLWPVVIAGYVLAFFFLSRTLKAGMALGAAYGTWSAVGVVVTALLAAALFDDHLSAPAICGVLLIAFGVYLVQK